MPVDMAVARARNACKSWSRAMFSCRGSYCNAAAEGLLACPQVAGAFKPQPAYRTWGAVPRKDPLLSFGIGGSLELDRGGLTPAMRVRFQDWLTVKVCPSSSKMEGDAASPWA